MNIRYLLLTAFGLGHLRPAPGTWGSLPPAVLAIALVWVLWPWWWMVDACLVLFGGVFAIACARFGSEGEDHFGRKDAREIVADEVAGQSLVLLFLPWRPPVDGAAWMWNLTLAAIAFGSFRLFDVMKPSPVYQVQRAGGGWGILADDLVAAVYAMIVTQVTARLVLPLI